MCPPALWNRGPINTTTPTTRGRSAPVTNRKHAPVTTRWRLTHIEDNMRTNKTHEPTKMYNKTPTHSTNKRNVQVRKSTNNTRLKHPPGTRKHKQRTKAHSETQVARAAVKLSQTTKKKTHKNAQNAQQARRNTQKRT